jgi:hypothetical protein
MVLHLDRVLGNLFLGIDNGENERESYPLLYQASAREQRWREG